jgi:hypothetical protein
VVRIVARRNSALALRAASITVIVSMSVCMSARAAVRPASCNRPSPFDKAPGIGGPEVIGSGSGAQIWGLIQARRFPLVASKDVVKIVWRMTGAGSLTSVEYSYNGKRLRLAWGPELHGSSNYARPGIEWGAGYRFTKPGCYRLIARRKTGAGLVWVRIKPTN